MFGAALESKAGSRRVLAAFLPDLLLELTQGSVPLSDLTGPRTKGKKAEPRGGKSRKARRPPLGVVLVASDAEAQSKEAISGGALLDAVNAEAHRCGVRAGQSIAEASALIAGLQIRKIARGQVRRALESVAEAGFNFGATVAIAEPDTIWIDVTGSAHLFGGEAGLAGELVNRVRAMGHAVRVAVASGPELSRMFARWAQPSVSAALDPGIQVIPVGATADKLRDLPVIALPLSEELREWLVRLGLLTLGEVGKLPASAVGVRLGAEARRVLALVQGRDDTPLVPFRLPRTITEQVSWEHEASGNEPLLFALRGLAAKVSARLSGRGEAAQSLVLSIEHAGAFARFHGGESITKLRFSLPKPLWREEDLRRIVSSRLERAKLSAPSVGLRLEVPVLVPAVSRQLELEQFRAGNAKAEDELPLVLAELVADLGEDQVGILKTVDSHRPEAKSTLVPVSVGGEGSKSPSRRPGALRKTEAFPFKSLGLNRLLPEPVRIQGAFHVGAAFAVEGRPYTVEKVAFEHRLEGVEWWSATPVSRDYLRLTLRGSQGLLDALVYVERMSGRGFLQGIWD